MNKPHFSYYGNIREEYQGVYYVRKGDVKDKYLHCYWVRELGRPPYLAITFTNYLQIVSVFDNTISPEQYKYFGCLDIGGVLENCEGVVYEN